MKKNSTFFCVLFLVFSAAVASTGVAQDGRSIAPGSENAVASAQKHQRSTTALPARESAPAATPVPIKTQAPAKSDEWTLNDFVAVTQLVSNVGVVIALLLTLSQLSSTIRLASNSAVQSNAHALNAFYVSLATSEDLARIYRQGRQDPTKLTAAEESRFFYACVAWFAHHEQAFGQVQSGLLPKEFFESWELALREDLADPGFQQFWKGERAFFDAPFRGLIDRIIAEISASRAASPAKPASSSPTTSSEVNH